MGVTHEIIIALVLNGNKGEYPNATRCETTFLALNTLSEVDQHQTESVANKLSPEQGISRVLRMM